MMTIKTLKIEKSSDLTAPCTDEKTRQTSWNSSLPGKTGRALAILTGLMIASPVIAGEGSWKKLDTFGVGPQNRSKPSAAAVDDSIYVFGGVEDNFATFINTFYNDLHRFDPETATWTLLNPGGQVPEERAFAASTSRKKEGEFVIYGGAAYDATFIEFEIFSDLWVYSVDTNAWTEIVAMNEGPGKRNAATLWSNQDKIYLFGGLTPFFTTTNDLWEYDFCTNRWTELIPDMHPGSPTGRNSAYSGDGPKSGKVTVYGGETITPSFDFETLEDVWQLNLKTLTWEDVTPAPSEDIDIHGNLGASTLIGNKLYVQGGDIPGGETGCGSPFPQNATDALWSFHLIQHRWRQLDPGGDPLPYLKRQVGVNIDGRFYVLGGFDFQCDNGTGPGQIWNNDVFVLDPDS